MRFDKTREFKIKDLDLDEGNYRFRKAGDQRECIEKIFQSSPDNFKNIMTSIAEDDIGELLLVYEHPSGDYIVMDGNRRTSALKVLSNPDLAPSDAIRKRAIALSEKYEIKTSGIQAQVSSDKNAILRTVYERHGSTGGKSRLNWPAIAKSRFGFDHDYDLPEAEWKVIALLYKLEDIKPELTAFFESSDYKHEVFRRIVPAALRLNVISENMFSDRDKKIKKSEGKLIKAAFKVCMTFFDDIKNGVIGLKRGKDAGIYASAEGLEEYLKRFDLKDTETNVDPVEPSPTDPETPSDGPSDDDFEGQPHNPEPESSEPEPMPTPQRPGNYGVGASLNLKHAVERTHSKKFEQLYNSICVTSLTQHPSLVMLGAWAFIEGISTALGKNEGIGIDSFFSKKLLTNWWPEHFKKNELDDFRNALEFIRKEANAVKHSPKYRSENAANLTPHFECLEPLLIKALDKLVSDKVNIK